MSYEFDGLDATEKAGMEAALVAASRPKLRANCVTRSASTSLTSCYRWQIFTPPLSALPMSSDKADSRSRTYLLPW
jgi:hypothetical protein